MDTEPTEDETKEETEPEYAIEQDAETEQTEEEQVKGPREPSNMDYLAGAMLANH